MMNKTEVAIHQNQKFVKLQANIKKNKDEVYVRQYLKEVGQLIREHHLGFILALHHNGALLELLETSQKIYISKKEKDLLEHLYPVFQILIQCLLDYDQKYKKAFKGFKTKWLDKCNLKSIIIESQYDNYKERRALIEQFLNIKHGKEELYAKGKYIADFRQNRLMNAKAKSVYDEVVINWLKQEVVSSIRNILKEKTTQDVGYCCNQCFVFSSYLQQMQYPNHYYVGFIGSVKKEAQEFDKQMLANKQNVVQIEQAKKKIVEYLNCRGGYILFGVYINPPIKNKGTFKGLQFTQEKRVDFLKHLLGDIVLKIYPTDGQNQNETDKQQHQRLNNIKEAKLTQFRENVKNSFRHKLSECIEAEFVPMCDCNLFDVINSEGVNRYIVRLSVTVGKSVELYFILNEKEIPVAYQGSTPLGIKEYYDKVYKNLKDEADQKLAKKQPLEHSFCINNLNYKG